MDVSQYLRSAEGLSAVLKLVHGVIFGSITMGSPGEGLAR